GISGEKDIYIDETILFENFMSSFNNAYLSEIDDSTYLAEAHKINYSGAPLEILENEKLEIQYCDNSWFEIVSNIIAGKKLSYNSGLYRNKDIDELQYREVINYCTDIVGNIIEFFISNQDWQSIIDEQLEVFNKDFRPIYQKGAVWFYSNYITDGNTTNTNSYFKDMTAKTVRDINSYVIRDNSKNYITKLIQLALSNYLGNLYSSKSGNDFEILNVIANKIIMNSLEKSIKISYKVFDRKLTEHNSIDNIEPIFIENSQQYVKPSNITLDDSNPLYIYLPFKVDTFIKNLIVSFKSISKNNTYIVLGGYKEDYLNQNELDLSYHLYVKFPELIGLIDYTYLIDSSKCFEIFTALSDTQRLSINPTSSFTISGSILNYNIKQNTPNNANHLSFVTLMDEYLSNSFVDSYLKGLTNKNNNFNYNF
ncbi:MAG: hypothetical protein RR942_10780, partial [Romboutsia sp.]